MDDIELRYNLLEKARAQANIEWEQRLKVEDSLASYEKRALSLIRPPTLHKIMSLAEKLYSFVKNPPEARSTASLEDSTSDQELPDVEEPSSDSVEE
jgi:hypothetical protein